MPEKIDWLDQAYISIQNYTEKYAMDDRAYFYLLKTAARSRAVDALNHRFRSPVQKERLSGLTICSIFGSDIGNALEFAENHWPQCRDPAFARSWRDLATSFANAPDHFDLALWQEVGDEQVLVGLALGNPSNARTHLTVKWIERYFGQYPLAGRVMVPILTCAEEYAKLLGSERVLVKDPIDPAKYERYGYEPYLHPWVPHGGNYLTREINDE